MKTKYLTILMYWELSYFKPNKLSFHRKKILTCAYLISFQSLMSAFNHSQ